MYVLLRSVIIIGSGVGPFMLQPFQVDIYGSVVYVHAFFSFVHLFIRLCIVFCFLCATWRLVQFCGHILCQVSEYNKHIAAGGGNDCFGKDCYVQTFRICSIVAAAATALAFGLSRMWRKPGQYV